MTNSCSWIMLLLAIGAPALARGDDRPAIRDLFARYRLTITGSKPAAMLQLETPDCIVRELGGQIRSGKQFAQEQAAMERYISEPRIDILIDKFQIAPPAATVSYTYYYSCVMTDHAGKFGPKGKRHSISTTGKVRTTLLKAADGWKFRSLENLSATTRVDRKNSGGPVAAP